MDGQTPKQRARRSDGRLVGTLAAGETSTRRLARPSPQHMLVMQSYPRNSVAIVSQGDTEVTVRNDADRFAIYMAFYVQHSDAQIAMAVGNLANALGRRMKGKKQ